MINLNNYFSEVSRIGESKLPDALQKGHDLVVKSTSNGSNWHMYQENETIRRVINLQFQKLSEFVAAEKRQTSTDTPVKEIKAAQKNVKVKRTASSIKKNTHAKNQLTKSKSRKVEHIRQEIKFIKRFVSLHNKTKSPDSILSFIKSLQRAILQRIVRKTSPLAEQIELIQERLITIYNKMKGETVMTISEPELSKLVAIAGGEVVYPSINIIKRYIGLQGRTADAKTLENFVRHIETTLSKSIASDDPYLSKVRAIYNTIKKKNRGEIFNISKTELSGLEGIIKDCACNKSLGKIYHTHGKTLRPCRKKTYSDANRGACSHNKGLSGVLTAEEMANRKLDLLPFTSFWHFLLGNPARNFTLMLHGEPHNGKTIFLLKLAQYLASQFGKVLYVSSEEFASPTMTKKVNEFLNPIPSQLHFAENLNDPNLSEYDFIIVDSVNDLDLKVSVYKEIRRNNPETSFIFILQHTKSGQFKGEKDWEHVAEIAGEIQKGIVNITKNRYASKNSLDFFNQFGLQWQEPLDSSETNTIKQI